MKHPRIIVSRTFDKQPERTVFIVNNFKLKSSIAVALLLLGTGCGPLSEVTGTVSGKVTLDGKAVPAGCSVICQHVQRSLPAVGKTAADGTFTLQMKDGNGIMLGKYKVLVQPPLLNLDPAEAMRMSQAGKLPKDDDSAVPKKYRSFDTSELTLTVKRGSNTFDIAMKP